MPVAKTSECHGHLVRTSLGAFVTHLIRVRGRAAGSRRIGVEAIIRGGDDHRSVAVNVDVGRCRPAP